MWYCCKLCIHPFIYISVRPSIKNSLHPILGILYMWHTILFSCNCSFSDSFVSLTSFFVQVSFVSLTCSLVQVSFVSLIWSFVLVSLVLKCMKHPTLNKHLHRVIEHHIPYCMLLTEQDKEAEKPPPKPTAVHRKILKNTWYQETPLWQIHYTETQISEKDLHIPLWHKHKKKKGVKTCKSWGWKRVLSWLL